MLCRDNACLLWSTVNYEHPYPDRERKDALGAYAGRNKPQVPGVAITTKISPLCATRLRQH